jgi:FtsZ-binding cell division protein ZapB
MDSGTIDEVTEWDSAPVSAGFEGLHDLADREFSGAVTTDGMTWAFLLNGNVIGVFDGTIDAFEDADLSAYVAPAPALPLLFAMREQGGETRAKYYTNDTPLSDADDTLSAGNFTGYVELSENVLSGDYYVVYYGGKSMSAAFVGNSRRLITGDEAFERADDEVGIYEVKEAEVSVVDVPEVGGSAGPDPDPDPEPETESDPETKTESDPDSETATGADDHSPSDPATDAPQSDGNATVADPFATEDETPSARNSTGGSSDAVTFDAGGAEERAAGEQDPAAETGPTAEARARGEQTAPESTRTSAEGRRRPPAESDGAAKAAEATDGPSEAAVDKQPPGDGEQTAQDPTPESADGDAEQEQGADSDVFTEEERWRNAQAIPALDPEDSRQTKPPEESRARGQQSRGQSSPSQSASRGQSSSRSGPAQRARGRSASKQAQAGDGRAAAPRQGGVDPNVVEKLKQKLKAAREAKQKLEAERDELAAERDGLAAERDELTAERDEYRKEAERLAERAESLESKVASLESRLEEAGVTTADRSISPTEALDGTNLFVRYRSKSEGTLEDAHKGNADSDEVNDNLRLEHHTTFETEGVAVEGRPFEDYLADTVEYRFVRWVVRDLLYEIRETNHRNDLDRLYDAVPQIDRAELNGSVSLKYTEEGEEIREQQSFDVVLRDRMGNPLVAADLNDSRREATEDMMTELIDNASRLRESSDSMAAAFLVTSSFFDPGALEAASEATGGGLLRRSKRKSFVKVSRKRGYHLCLVESRNDEFHVTVPEL